MKNIKHQVLLVALCVIYVLISVSWVHAHSVNYPVIVDTDMALDDIRAITMLLNSNAGQIQLMVASDGIRAPEEGIQNLKAILKYFNKSNIPVARGRILEAPIPQYRGLIKTIAIPGSTTDGTGTDSKIPASEMIMETIGTSKDPVIYLCLGPMTNLADALAKKPDIKNKIDLVIYYGSQPDRANPGWNTQRDTASAEAVFTSGLRIYAICPSENEWLPFDATFYNQIVKLDSRASDLLKQVHEPPEIKALLAQDHFYVWDELLVLYLNTPGSFESIKMPANHTIRFLTAYNKADILEAYLQSLGLRADMHLSPRHAVVLNGFPRTPDLFRSDITSHVQDIIAKHGMEEWKACVLTNEFHRHLGMYSIIGAKMGVRAREVLEAPFDSLVVTSHAGNQPPFSCLNDGLQVSTGASLGRGTITVVADKALPKAEFLYDHTKLTLTLKADIWHRIKSDIGALIKEYGGTTPEYFARVRELSITRWETWDRSEIFEESVSFEKRSKTP